MIVASYLVRIEPFAQHFLRLQGGHFDLADRMFHSIGDAWLSASKNNMADLKELIPEFFYLPEFLSNSNRFDFGCKQNGVKLDDVLLPPWAKDDTREFIRKHRAALECDYVSAHLNEWIDLIFGSKQSGPAAVEAVNVFHHLFYEGNADIYNINDPLKKNATIGFINNFGQIPKQLFKKPHPVKKVYQSASGPLMSSLSPILQVGLNHLSTTSGLSSNSSNKVFIYNLTSLKPSLAPIKELKGAVGQIIMQDKALLAVEQNKVLIPPLYNRYIAWGFADYSLRIGPYESDRALYIWESELFAPKGEILCATVPNSKTIITAGTNSVLFVWRVKSKSLNLSLVQKLYGHTDAVTCLASSSSYGIVVSGSRDKTCILWDFNRLAFVRQLGGGPSSLHKHPIAALAINDVTGDIATCCSTELFLWSINGDLIAQVNTATTNLPMGTPGASFSTMSSGTAAASQILCLEFSAYNEWDENNVILTGSSDGVVKMWRLKYVQEKIDYGLLREKAWDGNSSHSLSSSSSCEDVVGNMKALNLNKDDVVRRLSIVSLPKHDTKEEDSPDNSSSNDPPPPLPSQQLQSRVPPSLSCQREATLEDTCSFTDSFIMVNDDGEDDVDEDDDDVSTQYTYQDDDDIILRPGHRWATKLEYCAKLTMHTAYERADNKEPAAITCLALSKDHKSVFVGDARGRIFAWSVANDSSNNGLSGGRGTMQDHWIRDDSVTNCQGCRVKFSVTERRHHCRNCGLVFCSR